MNKYRLSKENYLKPMKSFNRVELRCKRLLKLMELGAPGVVVITECSHLHNALNTAFKQQKYIDVGFTTEKNGRGYGIT